jgi:ribonuclease R
LSVPASEHRNFKRLLYALEKAGKIYRVKGHRYGAPESMDLAVGRVSLTRRGDGFVRADSGAGEVFVPARDLSGAMDGDRIVVRIESRPRGRSPVGRAIKVLERARSSVVGTLHRDRQFSRVTPLDRRLTQDVMISSAGSGILDAETGDIVVVDLVSFGGSGAAPVGEIRTVLGKLSDPGVDILAIAHGYGLSLEFPQEVMESAEAAARDGLEEVGDHRVDRTDLLVFTVDPVDAKDHDDALSVMKVDGGWEVGVHIADVSHFVEEGGAIDIEAQARGSSVYLVDRVIPMLPEQLSGDACSLREGSDRLAVSLCLTLDSSGAVLSRRYEQTRVRSRRRLAYEEVQDVLDGRRSLGVEIDEAVRSLDDLARAIRARRIERGALDLDLPEARVLLDSEGSPVDIQRVERLESHRLIEDFMILANEVVARDLEAKGIPGLYRVHEPPTREKAEELGEFLARFGYRLPKRKALKPTDVQQLLDAVRGREDESLISTVVLRSLKRARYDPENLGHFGLASSAYLHFTSPIRRYPDLLVHRAVVRCLVRKQPPRDWEPDELRTVAELTSDRERSADQAERDSIAMKKVEFMEQHLGEEFEGRISGVAAFGFFVTLDAFFVDGLVHVNSLRDDFYHFQDRSHALVGDKSRRSHRLGDRVEVQVVRVDKEARHVDFLLLRKLQKQKV